MRYIIDMEERQTTINDMKVRIERYLKLVSNKFDSVFVADTGLIIRGLARFDIHTEKTITEITGYDFLSVEATRKGKLTVHFDNY